MKTRSTLNGIEYLPIIPPCGDSDELAEQSDRLIMLHGGRYRETTFIHAKKGTLHAGWVIGVNAERVGPP